MKSSALNFHFKKLQKWQQIKQKETGRKIIRAEITEIEIKCIIEFYETTSKTEQKKGKHKLSISAVKKRVFIDPRH